MSPNQVRVLIIDQDVAPAKKLATYLTDSGFGVATIFDGERAQNKILEFRPHFILIDLTMPNFSAIDCLDFLNEKKLLEHGETRVLILSHHNAKQNVEACLRRGAHDYIVKPVKPMDVLTRIALHLQSRKRLVKIEEIQDEDLRQTNYYLHLVELLIKATTVSSYRRQVHFQIVRMLAMAINAVRISLITPNDEGLVVIASSDNEDFSHFQLNLEKYPELDYVLRTQKQLFIESLQDDTIMNSVKDSLKSVHFNTMIVLPLCNNQHLQGILSVRFAASAQLTDTEIRLCQVVAQIIVSFWQQYQRDSKSKKAAS